LTRRNLKAGARQISGCGLNLFTDDELFDIHCGTLEVLHDTGIKVESKEAQQIFGDSGCDVNERTGIVKIPPHVVEDAIRTVPSALLMAGRDPKNDFVINGNRVGFTNFGEGIMITDPVTKEHRVTTKADVGRAALVCDAMDEIDVHERAVSARDVDPKVAILHEAEMFFTNTSKHCIAGAGTGKNLKKVIDIAASIVGGRDQLKKRPIYSSLVCPTSPLQLINDCCEVLIEGARAGICINVLSMAMAGGSSPVTLAGTLVTHNAEVLSGIVLSQLAAKGAPVLYGSSTTRFDLKYNTAPVGSPELGMINAAVAKLAQYYLIPSWVAGG
jgi:trimethylamine--corrinoid protein Co-methyltransferase